MVQSPSWETYWFAASQEIPRILRNPNVHYRTHKRPPPVPNLGQPSPVQLLYYNATMLQLPTVFSAVNLLCMFVVRSNRLYHMA